MDLNNIALWVAVTTLFALICDNNVVVKSIFKAQGELDLLITDTLGYHTKWLQQIDGKIKLVRDPLPRDAPNSSPKLTTTAESREVDDKDDEQYALVE